MASTGGLRGITSDVGDKFGIGTGFLPKAENFGCCTGGAGLAILAGSPTEKQEAAFKYIAFATSPEGTEFWSQNTGYGSNLELMLRMIDDDGSVISPRVFIPPAEKYNLVTAIDRWVIDHALEWLANHCSAHNWPITIAINLSGQSISSQEMLKYIIARAEQTGRTTRADNL